MRRILLVEDHASARLLLRRMIEGATEDVAIDEAASAKEAAGLWASAHHDIVFLDAVLLHDEHGASELTSAPAVALAKRLAASDHPPRIVVASGLHPEHPHMRELRSLAAAQVAKPFRAEDVRRALASLA